MTDQLNRLSGNAGVNGTYPKPKPGQTPQTSTGNADFERLLRQQRVQQQSRQLQEAPKRPTGMDFTPTSQAVAFSKHAQHRLEKRDIQLAPEQSARLETAITSAAGKGARQSLVYLDGMAFVVNVADRKVITALAVDGSQPQNQNVFTNIDSAVLA